MPASLKTAGYLVDGVALASATSDLTHDGSGLWTGVTEDVTVTQSPGRDGGDLSGGVAKPFTLSTLYTVSGTDAKSVWSAIVALRRLCKPRRTVTLTRVMPDPDGSDANTSHTATARRLTDRIAWLERNVKAGIDIDWLIVDGLWHGASVNIADLAGAHDIKGDLPTYRMTITLAAGAARTVENTTNGFKFTFGAVVPAGGVEIDVEALTATAITGGTDMSRYLSFPKTHPMRLEPDSNTFTVSAGTAAIDYQPAYQ